MIDENAGELVADRLVDQHRGDRRIDAARQPADHPALADAGADRLARLGAERGHRPIALQTRDLVDEIPDQSRAVGRMRDLGMEHQAVIAARLVGDQRERRIFGGADARKSRRQPGDAVAMAHPDDMAFAGFPEALEQRAGRADGDFRPAEFAMMAALHFAAELLGHRHLPVADAEHRHARREDRLRRARTARVGHGGGAAGEDHRLGLHFRKGALGALERRDFAIDARLAHAARDQLRELAAEVDDQQLVVGGGGRLGVGHVEIASSGPMVIEGRL